jgi:hypothetical protein
MTVPEDHELSPRNRVSASREDSSLNRDRHRRDNKTATENYQKGTQSASMGRLSFHD